MPEGETKETCEEHKSIMKKEMARSSNRNLALVRELMGVTFAYRREMLTVSGGLSSFEVTIWGKLMMMIHCSFY